MPSATDLRRLLRRARTRYRRPVAAALAGVAVLTGLSALRADPPASPVPTLSPGPVSRPGDVTLAVPLAFGAGALSPGDLVDLVSTAGSPAAEIIATDVLVADLASGSAYASASVILVAVPRSDALTVAAAAATAPLAVLIH